MQFGMRAAVAVALAVGLATGAAGYAALASTAQPVRGASQDSVCGQVDTIQRYACLIDIAARGASIEHPQDFEFYTILTAVQTIQTIASGARYTYLAINEGLEAPPSDQQYICLDEGFGACGNQMLLFEELMRVPGIPTRRVQFYHDQGRQSHAAAEALVDGKWRYVDLTWGSVWFSDVSKPSTMLSLEEIRAGQGKRRTSQIDPLLRSARASGIDVFAYLGDGSDITIDGVGTVNVTWRDGRADFSNVPNYIGDTAADGVDRRLELKLNLPEETGSVSFDISSHGECEASKMIVGTQEAHIDDGDVTISGVRTGDHLSISGPDPACYVIFSGMTAS